MVEQTVHCGEDAPQGSSRDVRGNADAVGRPSGRHIQHVDVGGRLCVGTGAERVLVVVQDLDLNVQGFLDAVLDRIDRSVSDAFKILLDPVRSVGAPCKGGKAAVVQLGIGDLALAEMDRLLHVDIVTLELFHDLVRSDLALLLGDLLDDVRELLVHALRKMEAEEGVHDEGHAALAGLGVDADHRLVLSADVAGVDGQIRNLPVGVVPRVHRLHALVDGILVGTGEGGEDQLACVRMARRDGHLRAALVDLGDLLLALRKKGPENYGTVIKDKIKAFTKEAKVVGAIVEEKMTEKEDKVTQEAFLLSNINDKLTKALIPVKADMSDLSEKYQAGQLTRGRLVKKYAFGTTGSRTWSDMSFTGRSIHVVNLDTALKFLNKALRKDVENSELIEKLADKIDLLTDYIETVIDDSKSVDMKPYLDIIGKTAGEIVELIDQFTGDQGSSNVEDSTLADTAATESEPTGEPLDENDDVLTEDPDASAPTAAEEAPAEETEVEATEEASEEKSDDDDKEEKEDEE